MPGPFHIYKTRVSSLRLTPSAAAAAATAASATSITALEGASAKIALLTFEFTALSRSRIAAGSGCGTRRLLSRSLLASAIDARALLTAASTKPELEQPPSVGIPVAEVVGKAAGMADASFGLLPPPLRRLERLERRSRYESRPLAKLLMALMMPLLLLLPRPLSGMETGGGMGAPLPPPALQLAMFSALRLAPKLPPSSRRGLTQLAPAKGPLAPPSPP